MTDRDRGGSSFWSGFYGCFGVVFAVIVVLALIVLANAICLVVALPEAEGMIRPVLAGAS